MTNKNMGIVVCLCSIAMTINFVGCGGDDDDSGQGEEGTYSEGGSCIQDDCICGEGDDCTIVCQGEETVGDGGEMEGCDVLCKEDSTCVVDCQDQSCDVVCSDSSYCEIDCGHVSNCDVVCPFSNCVVHNCDFGENCSVVCSFSGLPVQSGGDWICE